ncbi:hypothetical protein CEQ90_06805 [Lewinellaceae bacterium SD302]|nr:hypothetical protein CEQ90_06805 [Lewinellaceae bacterium SD302]
MLDFANLFNSLIMKKVYTLLAFLFVALSVQAQTSVTVAVDMTGQSGFDAVFVAGAFQNWTPGDGALVDQGNGVWARTYELAPGEYQYKFGKGNDWGDNEGGGLSEACGVDDNNGAFNRVITVGDEPMTVVFEYDSCDESQLPVNVNEISTISGVQVFPNPMVGNAMIRFENNANVAHDIAVSNIHGQVVRQFHGVRGNSLELDRGNLAAGLYLVTFRNDRNEAGTVRLMVQ